MGTPLTLDDLLELRPSHTLLYVALHQPDGPLSVTFIGQPGDTAYLGSWEAWPQCPDRSFVLYPTAAKGIQAAIDRGCTIWCVWHFGSDGWDGGHRHFYPLQPAT